jgi:hypothetical protein
MGTYHRVPTAADRPLLPENADLAPQSHQLLAFRRGQPTPLAAVDLRRLHPASHRGLGEVEIATDVRDGLARRVDQGDQLRLALVSEPATLSSSHLDLLDGAMPRIMVVRLTGSSPQELKRVEGRCGAISKGVCLANDAGNTIEATAAVARADTWSFCDQHPLFTLPRSSRLRI